MASSKLLSFHAAIFKPTGYSNRFSSSLNLNPDFGTEEATLIRSGKKRHGNIYLILMENESAAVSLLKKSATSNQYGPFRS
jgi:hypothetical protein